PAPVWEKPVTCPTLLMSRASVEVPPNVPKSVALYRAPAEQAIDPSKSMGRTPHRIRMVTPSKTRVYAITEELLPKVCGPAAPWQPATLRQSSAQAECSGTP